MVEQMALTHRIPVRVGDSEPKLYDTRLLPNCGGVILQTYHGKGVGWTATKWFNTEQEAKQWLKGGVPSTPRKK